MRKTAILCGLASVLAWAGCKQPGSAPATGATAPSTVTSSVPDAAAAPSVTPQTQPAAHYFQDSPQTNLMRIKLYVGPAETTAELCISLQQVATGLMHRQGIGPEETMLFVFGGGQPRSFYMKNVPFDISAGYIDEEGILREIVPLKAMDETPVPSKSSNIQFVLEGAPDWFIRHGVVEGASVRTEQAILPVAFAGRAQVR